MPSIHHKKPQRRKVFPKFLKEYRSKLREDFNERCGYCNAPELYFGGEGCFEIDHFAPKSKFPHLKDDYANLVYSCRPCNRAKGNKWVTPNNHPSHNGSEGFVDPCLSEFDQHLKRNKDGQIKECTPVGKYMKMNLDLGMLRHKAIWKLDMLWNKYRTLDQRKESEKERLGVETKNTREQLFQVMTEIHHYISKVHQ